MATDLRPQLEAIADGRTLAAAFAQASTIDAALVEKRQRDFRAWYHFSARQPGEPLPAPSEILTPLP